MKLTLLGFSIVCVASPSAFASDIALALKFAKKVLGDKATKEYKEYVDSKPDEALAIILESGRVSDRPSRHDNSTARVPAFTQLGKVRLAYPALLPIIEEASQKSGLPTELIDAVIRTESGYRPHAISRAGAQGLMQLMPKTARSLGVSNSLDPRQNVLGGAKYLRKMLDRFGRVSLALAAYNAGPGAVSKHKGVPPYKETQRYVQVVWQRYQMRLKLGRNVSKKAERDKPSPTQAGEQPLRPSSYE
jgi:soluble lytic murein transglycosylase-like protein